MYVYVCMYIDMYGSDMYGSDVLLWHSECLLPALG